jgi:hypothetical protein
MGRYKRGKMALYEVMSRARLKPGFGRTIEKIREQRAAELAPTAGQEVPAGEKSALEEGLAAEEKPLTEQVSTEPAPSTTIQWWRKPKAIQMSAGRIEFSLPYQLVIAVALGLVLVILAAYRLGQYSYLNAQQAAAEPLKKAPSNLPPKPQQSSRGQTPSGGQQVTQVNKTTSPDTGTGSPTATAGKNIIVIVEYKARADLVPVQAYFAENGIETEIVTQGGRYFLITKNHYDSFDKPGIDGYAARQKIIEVGAKYKGKAPQGYESFAPNFFKDAYGKKID